MLPEHLIETIKSSSIASRLAPGMIIDALFAEWDADRGRPPGAVREWADRELDRAFSEQVSQR